MACQVGVHGCVRGGSPDAGGQPPPAFPQHGTVPKPAGAEGEHPGHDGLPTAGGGNGGLKSSFWNKPSGSVRAGEWGAVVCGCELCGKRFL